MSDETTREKQSDAGENTDRPVSADSDEKAQGAVHEATPPGWKPQGADVPPKERQSPTGVPWTKPGHIAEPKERDWRDESADPYEGINREDPFKGRPETKVPQPEEPQLDEADSGPGQPRRR